MAIAFGENLMDRDLKKEIGVGIFFLVFAIAYMIGASKISTFTPFGNRGLDSRSVPELLATLTIILSVAHIIQVSLRSRKLKRLQKEIGSDRDEPRETGADCSEPAPERTLVGRLEKVISVRLLLSLIYLAAYTALYQPLGFILSSSGFLVAESFLLTNRGERKKWAVFIVLFSVGASVLIYFVFTKYLTLILPSGILG
jgi:putative tricarboxylic transport membrane protein